MGYYIGIGGVVTFKNSKMVKAVVEDIPLEHLVLETDCPYMAPVPHRGERNSSLNLSWVVKTISEIKGISPEAVEAATWGKCHEALSYGVGCILLFCGMCLSHVFIKRRVFIYKGMCLSKGMFLSIKVCFYRKVCVYIYKDGFLL